jgi:hypothetical protein
MLRYTYTASLVIIITSIKFALHFAIFSNCALNLPGKKVFEKGITTVYNFGTLLTLSLYTDTRIPKLVYESTSTNTKTL